MDCYFLSDIPSYLKINGKYLGVVSTNLSYLDIDDNDCFFEFLPFSNDFLPCYGSAPNHTLRIFNVLGNKIVYPVFNHLPRLPFKFIMQKSDSFSGQPITVTVYQDGSVKFFIDGCINDIKSLPFSPKDLDVKFYLNYVFISFSGEKIALYVYDLTTKKLVFSNVVSEFYLGGDLTVKKSYQTVTQTKIIERWNLSGEFSFLSCRDEKQTDYEFLHPALTPIAFFENAVIGGSVEKIVTPSFNDKIPAFKEFIGSVIKVIKPPFDEHAVYLIKNDSVSVCTLEYENRLISNVLIDDFY